MPDLQAALPRRRRSSDAQCGRKPVASSPASARRRATSPSRASSTSCSRPTWARSRRTRSVVYLRPETAQGIYVNFKNVLQFARKKLPFGIAQIGKSFRNEITPGNFVFRMREFEQMEMEYFVPPDEAERVVRALARASGCAGTPSSASAPTTCACASTPPTSWPTTPRATSDVEYLFPIGWTELEGIANRGDFDLTQHAEFSGEKLEYFDQETGERYVPHVIEPAAGADRATLAFLVDAYDTEEVEGRKRTVLRLHPRLAPVKVGGAAAGLQGRACPSGRARSTSSCASGSPAEYDEGGSIGKRYRRQDEIGTPWCVTVDGQTLEDGTVTLRDRDTSSRSGCRRGPRRRLAAARRALASPKLD